MDGKRRWLLVPALAALLIGCGQDAAVSAPTPIPDATPADAPTADLGGAPDAASDAGLVDTAAGPDGTGDAPTPADTPGRVEPGDAADAVAPADAADAAPAADALDAGPDAADAAADAPDVDDAAADVPECLEASDCPTPTAACQAATCEAGACGVADLPDASTCTDDDACTVGDACQKGQCVPGLALVCDDGEPCTDDACQQAAGCSYTPNSQACDDGNPCTIGDACSGGQCAAGISIATCASDSDCAGGEDGNLCNGVVICGGPAGQCPACILDLTAVVTCDPSADTACAQAACAPATGKCVLAPVADGAACDDGSVCSQADACQGGVCQGGPAPGCDDGNPCTTDSCDPAQGCTFAPNSTPCSDGSACTDGDKCGGGQCLPGQAIACSDGNACTDDGCDPAQGCTFAANTAPCSDGSACTTTDVCQGGVCLAGPTTTCDDDNACTSDSCDATAGCTFAPGTLPCDDGSVCTVGDKCLAGQCIPGKLVVCNDGNPCTDDACDATEGCTVAANTAPCNDGNACTTGDVCAQGACAGPAPVGCDDGNGCTVEWCDPAKGCQGLNVPGACDDGSACTAADACDAGKCQGKSVVCDDGNPCTADACKPETGCTAPAVADGTPCGGNGVCGQGQCSLGSQVTPAPSCKAILAAIPAAKSGVYWLDPNKSGAFQVYCDMVSQGGGWTSLVHLTPLAKLNFSVPHSEIALASGTSRWALAPRPAAKYTLAAALNRPDTMIEVTAPTPAQTGWTWGGVAWPNPSGCHVVQQLVLNQTPSELPRGYGNPHFNPGQAMPAAVANAAVPTTVGLTVAPVANFPAIHLGCVGWNVLKDPVVWVR